MKTHPVAIEGRDYEIRAKGAWVFTREYLIARGTCCQSKCLNCPYENERDRASRQSGRPVVSMVPSWTETLLAAGANVVGRTRFCIHPEDAVKKIPVFGGTKNLARDAEEKWQTIVSQNPGARPLVILDKEENPKDFLDFFSRDRCDVVATHVQDLRSLEDGFLNLAQSFHGSRGELVQARMRSYARRLRELHAKRKNPVSQNETLARAILETDAPVLYFIWKDPWMVVRHDTWIGTMLRTTFADARFALDEHRLFSGSRDTRYPEVAESEVPPGAILLFSSEPYPFGRELKTMADVSFFRNALASGIVDGEVFSWFGLRSLRHLEER